MASATLRFCSLLQYTVLFALSKMISDFFNLFRNPIQVSTALADFPHELIRIPRAWLDVTFPNIVQFTEMPRGGHFGAFQEPQLMADDVWEFVKKVEKIPKAQ
jgi:hypothetical protein